MSQFAYRIQHLSSQIISDYSKVTVDDAIKISIRCHCGTENVIGARSFVRRWEKESEYRCKSCDVKTYINDPERVERAKKSYIKTLQSSDLHKKLSDNGKKAWTNPIIAERIKKAVSEDNKTNPLKKEALNKASAAFMARTDYKNHLAEIRANQRISGKSILEDIVKRILEELSLNFEQHFVLSIPGDAAYVFDFKIDNLLIECQGEYWHRNSVDKDSAKATYAARLGYDIMHIWEHDFDAPNKVRDMILRRLGFITGNAVDFKIGDVIIKSIDTYTARVFLGCYHYLPAISKYGRHYGAFLDDILIAVVTFSGIIRKEIASRLNTKSSIIRELSRFCIHPDYHKKNFASWCLSKMISMFSNDMPLIRKLITFADHDVGHDGTIYKATNWKYDGEINDDYYYRSIDQRRIHKKTVWDRAKKLQMKENDYAIEYKYSKIACKGKSRFVFDIKN